MTNFQSGCERDDKRRYPVVFLLSSLTIGGSEGKAVRIVNEMHRKGWDVHLVYLNGPSDLLSGLSKDVPVACLGRSGKLSVTAIMRLRSYIRKMCIRSVVCVNLYPLIYAVSVRCTFSPSRKLSIVVTVNTTDFVGRKARLQMLLYRRLIPKAQKVIFGCKSQLELWCTRYGIDKRKCKVIYNGVDEKKFAPQPVSDRPCLMAVGKSIRHSSFVIGTIGQLRPEKNQIELVETLACLRRSLKNAILAMVGDGAERQRLEAAAIAKGVNDRTCFLGQLPDVRSALNEMDVIVIPSISETFSNAALEAMSMGKVVILSDTGGAREMVQDGIDGYIYEQGDTDSLSALITRLAEDPDTRQITGRRARDTILRRFSFAKMASEYQLLLMQDRV